MHAQLPQVAMAGAEYGLDEQYSLSHGIPALLAQLEQELLRSKPANPHEIIARAIEDVRQGKARQRPSAVPAGFTGTYQQQQAAAGTFSQGPPRRP
eukprot:369146_1